MTILVTGASGFIGRHLCAQLTAQGQDVLAVLRNPAQLTQLREHVARYHGAPDRVQAIQGDLDAPGLGLTRPLPPLQAIVHLGARFAWNMPADLARTTNVQGARAVVKLAAEQHCRLVMISGFMLENPTHLHHLGIDPDKPDATDWARVYRRAGAYEASKLEGALRVRQDCKQQRVALIEVQPATVAGHSQTGELDPAQPLYNLIENSAKGRLAQVPGTPAHWLPLVAVDTVAALISAACIAPDAPARVLALDDRTPNLQGLLGWVAVALGRKAPRRHIPLPLLAALLRIPGMPRLMNTAPEALSFIQPQRFDVRSTQAFAARHGIPWPDMAQVVQASVAHYRHLYGASAPDRAATGHVVAGPAEVRRLS